VSSLASELATWATDLGPTAADFQLADRSLLDTVSVAIAARAEPVVVAIGVSEAARRATAAYVLDFDDLHMESTTHISAVCMPAVLASGGGPRAYLAAAGVMARIGRALGWSHYTLGWHVTTISRRAGCSRSRRGARSRRRAIGHRHGPGRSRGGQRAFGTDAKSLQVGFAADAGVRAGRLAAAGATRPIREPSTAG